MTDETQQMMKAVEIESGILRLTDRPVPVPATGEVLIRVYAAGINRPDIIQRLGKYPPPPGITDIPGLEVAGEIVESGEKICALLAGGGYAEYAVAPAGQCLPIPENLDMIQAAALPETIFTVWNNLFKRGHLQYGETALIHGGASGIGTTAIQMAKAWGATVITTAGSDEKCGACQELGADLAINYKTQDFVEESRNFTEGKGVDVILDMIGGDYLPRNIDALAEDGRHVSIAFMKGIRAEIDIKTIMQKRLTLTGSTLRPRPVAEKEALAQEIKEHIWPLIESGQIMPVIFKTFSLAQASEAHQALEKGDHIGKLILKIL